MEGPPVYSFGLKSVLLMGLNLFSELEEIAETGSQVILWVGETLRHSPWPAWGFVRRPAPCRPPPSSRKRSVAPSSSREEALPQLPSVRSDRGQFTFLLFSPFWKKVSAPIFA